MPVAEIRAAGWLTPCRPDSREINHDGIDGRLAVAGSQCLHHHVGIIKRIRDVQDVETSRKDSPVQPANPFFTLQHAASYRRGWR
ncbi:citrate lyase subunit alpha [Klebsiella quasipneumoniae]|nr:citrate lyase subunit alpha [Klebsiella quasipneumoniae]PLD52928.1 citrate lyase subunit alpha [Klebsiella quasipneumoniae]PLF14578.1 citrate lyase subunit alpha [Klebsiella quasipneumoniae]PLF80573.1 citrate lyase subunit alpha [Klebsiella quasipneumoniae]PLF81655.1 citrate lyase subunit alpha [Klebsiella quasipneumoniae]